MPDKKQNKCKKAAIKWIDAISFYLKKLCDNLRKMNDLNMKLKQDYHQLHVFCEFYKKYGLSTSTIYD